MARPGRDRPGMGRAVSVDTYRAAAVRLRGQLDLLGPYVGPCECGRPDVRHLQADSIALSLARGDDPEKVAAAYLPGELAVFGETVALMVAVAVLAADRRVHGLTAGRAAGVDREVWADLTTGATRGQEG